MGIKDEEMAGLSDEERAALEDDDDGEADILKGIAGDSGDEDDDSEEGKSGDGNDDADDDSDDEPDAGAQPEPKPKDADAAGASDEESPVPAVQDEFRPEFKAAVPVDLTEKLADIDQRTTDLLAKFKDGDIDMPDFMAQKGQLDSEKLKLMLAQGQAEWATSQNADTRSQRWAWEQERFFANATNAATYKDPFNLDALDSTVKRLANDPANAKKAPGWFLEEADRQVRQRFNMGEAAPKAKTAPNRQPDLSKLPKTLAQLPAADVADTGGDEFAHLDKLDGIALEQALRKMTPEQEARYLGAA